MRHLKTRMNAMATTALLMLAACSQDAEMEGGKRPIRFFSATGTRAAVTATDDLSDFVVWGGTDNTNNLFDATTVTKEGTYTGTRYWIPGKSHNFYALHPAGLTGAGCTAGGTRTVTGFDATARRGNEAVDLMTAEQTGLTLPADRNPQPVPLSFSHELSRVRFTAKADQATTVTGVSLLGVFNKADFATPSTWENPSTEGTPVADDSPVAVTPESESPAVLLGGDLLMIPQELTEDCTLTVTWNYGGDDTYSQEIALAEVTGRWQKGQSYNYTLTIPATNTDIDITAKAGDWNTPQNVEVEL